MRILLLLSYLATTVGLMTPLNHSPVPSDGRTRKVVQIITSLPVTALEARSEAEAIPRACSDYYPEVKKYDWDPKIALAIMKAESGCHFDSVGDNWPINGLLAPSCGLMQVRTLKGRPSCEELFNAATNIAWSYKLYAANGWQPWTMFKNGAYIQYLDN